MTDQATSTTDKRAGTDDLWEAIYTNRAIRYWTDQPVSDETMLKIIEAGTKAPSGTNTQPWRFLVIRDAAMRAKINDRMREWYEGNEGFQNYLTSNAESDDRSKRLMGKSAINLFLNLGEAPVMLLACLYRDGAPLGKLGVMSGSSIYGAVQNMLLAARGLGVGTVMTTMNANIEPELREWLEIPETAQPVALIPLGYPARNFGSLTRIPAPDVTFWEKWGETK